MKIKFLFVLKLFIAGMLMPYLGFGSQHQSADSTTGNAGIKKVISAHKVYIGSGYGNDLLYDGSSLSANQPYVSADLNYVYRGKLWFSATAYNLPHLDLMLPMADLAVGFNHYFNDVFDISVALSNYRTAAEIKQQMYDNFSFFRVKGGIDWYWLYTTLAAGRMVGESSGMYYYFRNSKYFRTPDMGKSKSYFTFDPNFNMVYGTQISYDPIVYTKSFPGKPPVINPPTSPGGEEAYYTTKTSLGLVKMELSIPTAFVINRFTIEAEPVYLLPLKTQTLQRDGGFYFFLNAYYRIF
jgi:hypothetical protein